MVTPDDAKLFQKLLLGDPPQYTESYEFNTCSDSPLSAHKILDALQADANSSDPATTPQPLLKLIADDVRRACRSKSDFSAVIDQPSFESDCGEVLSKANVDDFILTLIDSSKYLWQSLSLYDTLFTFDYPIPIGHKHCVSKFASPVEGYSLHLADLQHLVHRPDEVVFAKTKPNLLAVGTESSNGKSLFLNKIWNTKFERWDDVRGLFHEGLLEMQCASKVGGRGEHIFDVHGGVQSIPSTLLTALFSRIDVVLLQATALDFKIGQGADCSFSDDFELVFSQILASTCVQKVLVVVRGIPARKWQASLFSISSCIEFRLSAKSKTLRFDFMPIADDWRDNDRLVAKYHSQIADFLAGTDAHSQSLFGMFKCLAELFPSSQTTSLEKMRKEIDDELEACFAASHSSSWFPLQKNSFYLAEIEDKILGAINEHSEAEWQKRKLLAERESLKSVPPSRAVQFFRDLVSQQPDVDRAALAVIIFEQELSRRTRPIIAHHRKNVMHLEESLAVTVSTEDSDDLGKQIVETNRQLFVNDISQINFVRELVERSEAVIDEEALKIATFVCQNELMMGRSVEIVDGDSFKVSTQFLQKTMGPVLEVLSNVSGSSADERTFFADDRLNDYIQKFFEISRKISILSRQGSNSSVDSILPDDDITELLAYRDKVNHGNFCSVTIVGVESSGKSTLWNELWNTNFPVSHGKCSRGLRTAFIYPKNGPALLVNDTEGICSPNNPRPSFDKKLILLAFSISNIIVFNVRGEAEHQLLEILQLIFYAALRLEVLHRPRIIFVHRDVVCMNTFETTRFKNALLRQMDKFVIEDGGKTIDVRNVIDRSMILAVGMPSAVIERMVEVAGLKKLVAVRPAEFIESCGELRHAILNMARNVMLDRDFAKFPSQIIGEFGWVQHVKKMWILAKQNATPFTYNSFFEMLQRSYIEYKRQVLYHKFIDQKFNPEVEKLSETIISRLNYLRASLSEEETIEEVLEGLFEAEVHHIQKRVAIELIAKLKEAIEQYPRGGVSHEMKEEYVESVKRKLMEAADNQRELFNIDVRSRVVSQDVDHIYKEEVDKLITTVTQNLTSCNPKQVAAMFDIKVEQLTEQFKKENSKRDFNSQSTVMAYCRQSQITTFDADLLKHKIHSALFKSTFEQLEDVSKTNPNTFSPEYIQFLQQKETNPKFKVEPRKWVFAVAGDETPRFPSAVNEAFFSLENTVYKFFWGSGAMCTNDKKLVKNLFTIVEGEVVAIIRKITEMTKFKADRIHQSKYCEPGLAATVANIMHTFSCAMLHQFLKLKWKRNLAEKADKLREYSRRRRQDMMLRVEHAENCAVAARTIALRIIETTMDHVQQEALKTFRRSVYSWSVITKHLDLEAKRMAFQSGNYDDAFEYIVDPMAFLRDAVFTPKFEAFFFRMQNEVYERFLNPKRTEPPSKLCQFFAKTGECCKLWSQHLKALTVAENCSPIHETRQYSFSDKNSESHEIVVESKVQYLFEMFAEEGMPFLGQLKEVLDNYLQRIKFDTPNSTMYVLSLSLKMLFDNAEELITQDEMASYLKVAIGETEKEEMFRRAWEKSRGCENICHYCHQKCTEPAGHELHGGKHRAEQHWLQAFGGFTDRLTGNARLEICTDPRNLKSLYLSGDSEWLLFQEHMIKHCPDWYICEDNGDADSPCHMVNDFQKIVWVAVRERLAKRYGYNPTACPQWEKLYQARLNESARASTSSN